MEWMQEHGNDTLTNMTLNVSDNSMLMLYDQVLEQIRNTNFKFKNSTTNLEKCQEVVSRSWNTRMKGMPIFIVWRKLHRFQPIIKGLSKPIIDVNINIIQAREDLLKEQTKLISDRMNTRNINKVKKCSEELIKWQEFEVNVLRQREKIDRLRLGDRNNNYFHASIKMRQKFNNMRSL